MTLIFVVTWLILLFYAVRLMSQGWNTTETKPVIEEKKRQVTRPPHPEMAEVKSGDELLVVNFNRQPEEPKDPLYKSLHDRMNSGQVEDPWDEEEDEDDDGDIVIGRR